MFGSTEVNAMAMSETFKEMEIQGKFCHVNASAVLADPEWNTMYKEQTQRAMIQTSSR